VPNTAGWDLDQLLPSESVVTGWKWDYGVTPLSDITVLPCTWLVYWTVIFSLQGWMKDKEPYKLKWAVVLHNLFLMLWSLGMLIGLSFAGWQQLSKYGWQSLFCGATEEETAGPMQYCLYIFYTSKFYELLDTVLIVLKKKPLGFLHVYHHTIVLAMTWSWLHFRLNFACLGMFANCLVHTFMYYYYYASAQGAKVWFKQYITTMQLVQFATSFALTVIFKYLAVNGPCIGGDFFGPLEFSVACNVSFFFLFIRFFIQTYSKKKAGAGAKDGKKKE